jgi:hypothetical protein
MCVPAIKASSKSRLPLLFGNKYFVVSLAKSNKTATKTKELVKQINKRKTES